MTEVLFLLPGEDGSPTASGEEFRHLCNESDPISSLFNVIKKQLGQRLGQATLHLALERGNTLAEIHPKSKDTVASLKGARIIVGFKRA
jgi:hypothetical protein